MNRKYFVLAGIFAFIAVALGAFGAHGLQNITADEKIIHGFQTGVQYQLYHSLALLTISLVFYKLNQTWLRRACICFVIGIILFPGSLYLLTFLKIQQSEFVKFAGPVTPIGGLFFLAGWACLIIAGIRSKEFQK